VYNLQNMDVDGSPEITDADYLFGDKKVKFVESPEVTMAFTNRIHDGQFKHRAAVEFIAGYRKEFAAFTPWIGYLGNIPSHFQVRLYPEFGKSRISCMLALKDGYIQVYKTMKWTDPSRIAIRSGDMILFDNDLWFSTTITFIGLFVCG
jgi:hypothetical protein